MVMYLHSHLHMSLSRASATCYTFQLLYCSVINVIAKCIGPMKTFHRLPYHDPVTSICESDQKMVPYVRSHVKVK